MTIRTRFAPSPTGKLHIGGLRTALFAYLFAKKMAGKFILRIEDTDQNRLVAGASELLYKNLLELNIIFDESFQDGGEFAPYIQSQRLELYQRYAQELVAKKNAYYCFCSPQKLETMKAEQIAKKQAPKYDGSCRRLDQEQIKNNLQNRSNYTIRMKINHSRGNYHFTDLVKGEVNFKSSHLDDSVILKSDGYPTYHLACVIDDYLMKISHVIRGEEWLSSTPKHLQLYEYFDWKAPKFVHLPLLLATDKSKLSKRHGSFSVEDYLKQGFLKESIINFVALLGWNPGDRQEFFSLEELTKNFSIERIGKSGSIFDIKKLQWMNQQYLKKLSEQDFINQVTPFLNQEFQTLPTEKLKKMIMVVRESLTQLNQINEKLGVFFVKQLPADLKPLLETETAQKVINSLIAIIQKTDVLSGNNFTNCLKHVQQETQIKGKNLWMSTRIALTNCQHGPELPLMAEIYGKEKCLEKLKNCLV